MKKITNAEKLALLKTSKPLGFSFPLHFYEDPILGDEVTLIAKDKDGDFYRTPFYDIPDREEMEGMI